MDTKELDLAEELFDEFRHGQELVGQEKDFDSRATQIESLAQAEIYKLRFGNVNHQEALSELGRLTWNATEMRRAQQTTNESIQKAQTETLAKFGGKLVVVKALGGQTNPINEYRLSTGLYGDGNYHGRVIFPPKRASGRIEGVSFDDNTLDIIPRLFTPNRIFRSFRTADVLDESGSPRVSVKFKD